MKSRKTMQSTATTQYPTELKLTDWLPITARALQASGRRPARGAIHRAEGGRRADARREALSRPAERAGQASGALTRPSGGAEPPSPDKWAWQQAKRAESRPRRSLHGRVAEARRRWRIGEHGQRSRMGLGCRALQRVDARVSRVLPETACDLSEDVPALALRLGHQQYRTQELDAALDVRVAALRLREREVRQQHRRRAGLRAEQRVPRHDGRRR